MEQYSIKELSERAMYYGTILGAVMILTNIFYLAGLNSSIFSTLFLIFFLATPFVAGRLTALYRKRERENSIKFSEAWLFLLIMFMCGFILSALSQLIYFLFIDGGYFMTHILEQFATVADAEEIDPGLKEQITTTAELLKTLGVRDIVLQIFVTNIMFSPIITLLITIFVTRNPQKK